MASCSVLSNFPENSLPIISDDLVDSNKEQLGYTAEEMPDDITFKRQYGQSLSVVAVFVEHGNKITVQLAILSSIVSMPLSLQVFIGR